MIEIEILGVELPGERRGAGEASHAAAIPTPEEIRRLCSLAAASAGVHDGHVAIAFVGERRISELNERYRGQRRATDVLSFPIDGAGPQQGTRELGDVVICLAHTADTREAIVHGVLHLVGMDHETDQGEMLALQRELLAKEPS